MKIAFFSDCYLDLTGGIVTTMNSTKAELERLGHTVYIFSSGFPRSKEAKFELAQKNIFMVPSCRWFFRGLAPIARRPKIIEKWLILNFPELKDFDVFHVHYEAGCSIAAIRLAKQYKIPVVQTMHGREDMGETNLIPKGFRSFVAGALATFQSWYLPTKKKVEKDDYLADSYAKRKMWEIMVNHASQADVVVTPSEQFANKLKHYGVQKKIEVVPNAVADAKMDHEVAVRKLDEGEKLQIIWHSRVSAEKRMMPFLQALALVPKDQYHVEIFGGGGDYFRAKRFVKNNQISANFHNTAAYEKVLKQIQKSHLDVLVSYGFDTFGMTLIEAEAEGVPALICDPDLEEVLPKGGYVLADGLEPEKIAAAIRSLIRHPEEVEKMSKILIQHRDEVRQSARIEKLINIYEKVSKK